TVAVLGQVGRPVMLPLHRGMRLTEALGAAGGVTTDGSRNDIRIVRGPAEMPTVYQASLADIADGEQHDVELTAGDTVFVTDSFVEDASEVFGVVAPLFSLALVVAATAFALTY